MKKPAILVLTVTQSLSPLLAVPHDFVVPQDPTKQRASASSPQCATIGTNDLTVTCAYTASSTVSTNSRAAPRIILDRAVISFVPSNESHMKVALTFRNDSGFKRRCCPRSPGPYIVSIWIPSADPSLKFDPAHNFLLSSNGVPDPATGLNQIAKFTVATSAKSKSQAEPD